ncbi:hypothetical protein SH528x_002664 [Novipirellula sp. SH528]|uniref:hypothetical protein n=1 Tax=Novipirellula sp. SH528 TaxID=3454466 RepID=UPI003FA0DA60
MRFTLKHMLVMIALVALLLAGISFLHRSFAVNPDSERFTLLGNDAHPNWQTCDRITLNSTVVSEMISIEPEGGYRGSADVDFNQRLFDYRYTDCFGSDTYRIEYSLTGHYNSDWTDFYLLPTVSGGGNTSASAEISTEFNEATRTISVRIHQQFALRSKAKNVTLHFAWNGTQFALSENTERSNIAIDSSADLLQLAD